MVEPQGLGGPASVPPELADLLSAADEAATTLAWDRFLDSYGDLILRTSRSVNRDHDAAMDAYTHVLERFHANHFARLRRFSGGDHDNLARWLVVVSRRMCLDLHRHRYGRTREHTPERERLARKRLVDELWEKRKPPDLPDPGAENPEMELRWTQLGFRGSHVFGLPSRGAPSYLTVNSSGCPASCASSTASVRTSLCT